MVSSYNFRTHPEKISGKGVKDTPAPTVRCTTKPPTCKLQLTTAKYTQSTWCRLIQALCLSLQSLWAHMDHIYLIRWVVFWCPPSPLNHTIHLLVNHTIFHGIPCALRGGIWWGSPVRLSLSLHNVWLWVSTPTPICRWWKILWWQLDKTSFY